MQKLMINDLICEKNFQDFEKYFNKSQYWTFLSCMDSTNFHHGIKIGTSEYRSAYSIGR